MPIERRGFLRTVAGLGGLTLVPRFADAEAQVARATQGTPAPRIKDISVIECEPDGVRLTVVKITTDQDGLYGYGCATFTQRADLVKPAVDKYLKPFLLNKTTDRIEDIWQSCYDSSYWKNGPVLNNAISGVDQALWDIKGRQAGMPVYQLAGGKCREAADSYVHAAAPNLRKSSRMQSDTWLRAFAMFVFRWACLVWQDTVHSTRILLAPRRCMTNLCLIPQRKVDVLLSCLRFAAASSAMKLNFFTICMSGLRLTKPSSFANRQSSSGCSFLRTRSLLKILGTSARSARIAPRRSRWANSSIAHMNGSP